MSQPLQIRLMQSADIPFALGLSGLMGWNQTEHDWRRLHDAHLEGCFIAEWEGKSVGTVTTTPHGSDLAWIGMLLVKPELQGRGIGKALLNKAIESLRSKSVSCIKLDATPAGQPLYERLGFKAEWSLQRWETRHALVSGRLKFKTRTITMPDRDHVLAMDLTAFGAPRHGVLMLNVATINSVLSKYHQAYDGDDSRCLVNESPSGKINGFGFVRKGARATYLGPVVAEHLSAASAVVRSLLHPRKEQVVYWDIPDHQPEMIAIAKGLGFHSQRSLVRMYLGDTNVAGEPDMIYALAAPEIG